MTHANAAGTLEELIYVYFKTLSYPNVLSMFTGVRNQRVASKAWELMEKLEWTLNLGPPSPQVGSVRAEWARRG